MHFFRKLLPRFFETGGKEGGKSVKHKHASLGHCERGVTSVEQIVLVVTVALGFAAAVVPLGSLLAGYHEAVEYVLWLPIP